MAEVTSHAAGSATASWVAIQRNPTAGTGWRRVQLLEFVRELRRLGLRPRVFSNRDRLTRWLAEPGRKDQVACVVAAGGDGTVSDVINRCPGLRLAILPMGTENLLARYLDVPRSGRDVARMIASGRTRTFDLGQAGNTRFAVVASAGIDADVICRFHAQRRGNISRLSYVQPILESWRKYTYPELRVWLDDEPQPRSTRMVMLFNLPAYAMRLPFAASATGDDGRLDVRLFDRGSTFHTVRYLINVALRRHERLPDVQVATASRVRVECDIPVPIELDGDPGGMTPTEFHVLPAAQEIVVPENFRF